MIADKGIVEVKAGDNVYGFKFGTYTFKIIRDLSGIETMEEVFHRLTKNNNVVFLSQFLQACAMHYAKEKKMNLEMDEMIISNWMDEIGVVDSRKLVTALITSFTSKNLQAPVTAGQEAKQE